ncbi:NADH dehydrogenase (ubiquinone) 1 alpha subcomplex 5 [Blastomyces parvus]|uniref:NADH dehydrogenase (Ubiquinone) 1 alpha subcomplex 5 n=1 Tax=Blastomyces parvus TaxID=2060905 RepID=A0A2B7X5A7_9EURO|nr:NADH dehydrogenase (ubiquinone) 1 alpha subcomplex 5 [Blastomyces parvus]
MRSSLRLLANVKSARYLQPHAPTGLTGLTTHPRPRQALLILYTNTLNKLQNVPESSVYRQATEALTKQRLKIVESTKPPGYDKWQQEVQQKVAANPDLVKTISTPSGGLAGVYSLLGGRVSELEKRHYAENMENALHQIKEEKEQFEKLPENVKPAVARWSKEKHETEQLENKEESTSPEPRIDLYEEPALEAAQISEIENQIGAGLIEEVIEVAEGELKLVDDMIKFKVWEELVEKPKPGQWTYFGRERGSDAS